jgi:hypothetical protein
MRFFTSGFFSKTSSSGPLFHDFEFTEIFNFKADSAVSMTSLSQKGFPRQPPFVKLLPQRCWVVKFTLAWI